MIEMRWLRNPETTTEADRLQYRVHMPRVDSNGALCPGSWSDWQDVPVEVDEDG